MKFKTHKEPINTNLGKKKTHWKMWLLLWLFFTGVFVMAGYGVKSFFDKYYIVSPVQDRKVKLIIPTPTPTKAKQAVRVVEPVYASEPVTKTDLEIAQYIALKDWDYATAIRIAKSENFWNKTNSFDCTREGSLNSNGTRDHGLWQINDIHIQSGEITLEDTLDCFKSTDFAYRLYARRNNTFGAWSAYNNGSYLNHTIINL